MVEFGHTHFTDIAMLGPGRLDHIASGALVVGLVHYAVVVLLVPVHQPGR